MHVPVFRIFCVCFLTFFVFYEFTHLRPKDKICNKVAKGAPQDEVDKSVAVLAGFGDKELEEAQNVLNRVMAEVDVHFNNNTPIIACAGRF